MNWHWPQYVLASLYLIGLLLHARDHGKPKTGKDNFFVAAVSIVINIVVLHFGGFW